MRSTFLGLVLIVLLTQCITPSKIKTDKNKILMQTASGQLQIQWCTSTLFRISYASNNTPILEHKDTLLKVNSDWPLIEYTVTSKDGQWQIESDSLLVNIDQTNLALNILSRNGEEITKSSADKNKAPMGYNSGHPYLRKQIDDSERIYTFDNKMNFINQLGQILKLEGVSNMQFPNKIDINTLLDVKHSPSPIYISTKGYGLFLHNSSPSNWDLGHSNPNEILIEAEGGDLDYYFIYGSDFLSIIQDYTKLTHANAKLDIRHLNNKEDENYQNKIKELLTGQEDLYNRLMPYIYSSLQQMYKTGIPAIRPLVMHYPHDENTYQIDDQYMLGDNIMVCPLVSEKNEKHSIYLPSGEWYDFWTGYKYSGKRDVVLENTIEWLPIFVKSAGIIPMQTNMEYAVEKTPNPLTILIFPGLIGEFNMYEDGGTTQNPSSEPFGITQILTSSTKEILQVVVPEVEGDYFAKESDLIVKIARHDMPKQVVMTVDRAVQILTNYKELDKLNSAESGWHLDKNSGVLYIKGKRIPKTDVRFMATY